MRITFIVLTLSVLIFYPGFAFGELDTEVSGGFIPCGRSADDASTSAFDESEPCGIQHIFLLLKNLLDFALWRLSLFILLVLAVITGAVSYFSLGEGKILVRIKSIWKSF